MWKKQIAALVIIGLLAGALMGCAEVRQGTRSAGTYVGEAAAVPDELNRGINEGYRDDPGPNPYNR